LTAVDIASQRGDVMLARDLDKYVREDLKAIQNHLNFLGYDVPASGTLDGATQQSLAMFGIRFGLKEAYHPTGDLVERLFSTHETRSWIAGLISGPVGRMRTIRIENVGSRSEAQATAVAICSEAGHQNCRSNFVVPDGGCVAIAFNSFGVGSWSRLFADLEAAKADAIAACERDGKRCRVFEEVCA
jgi:hypothetical protein